MEKGEASSSGPNIADGSQDDYGRGRLVVGVSFEGLDLGGRASAAESRHGVVSKTEGGWEQT
jgi:hypothetical protein